MGFEAGIHNELNVHDRAAESGTKFVDLLFLSKTKFLLDSSFSLCYTTKTVYTCKVIRVITVISNSFFNVTYS